MKDLPIKIKGRCIFMFHVLSLFTWTIGSLTLSAGNKGHDVVIYGGTSAGIIAAVQTAKMNKSVLLIEPGKHLGGKFGPSSAA